MVMMRWLLRNKGTARSSDGGSSFTSGKSDIQIAVLGTKG